MKEKNNTRLAVQVLLDTGKGWLFQSRDNIDGILWPGCYSLWGGAMEPEDEHSPEMGAWRELHEELSLGENDVQLTRMDVVLYSDMAHPDGKTLDTETHYFYAKALRPLTFHSNEGASPALMTYSTDFDYVEHMTPFAREALRMVTRFKLDRDK